MQETKLYFAISKDRIDLLRIEEAERGTIKPRRADNVINGAKRFPPTSFRADQTRQEMSLFWPIERQLSLHRRHRRPRRRRRTAESYLEGYVPLFIGSSERGALTQERHRRRRGQRFTLMHVVYSSRPYLAPQFRDGCVDDKCGPFR